MSNDELEQDSMGWDYFFLRVKNPRFSFFSGVSALPAGSVWDRPDGPAAGDISAMAASIFPIQ